MPLTTQTPLVKSDAQSMIFGSRGRTWIIAISALRGEAACRFFGRSLDVANAYPDGK
jgi:hypothetical protein